MSNSSNFISPSAYQTVSLKYDDAVAILTLSRPDAMNAMNEQFFIELRGILDELSCNTTQTRALLIVAEGKNFCVGADLKDFENDMPPNLGHTLVNDYNPLIKALKKLPIPTVVAVNGAAAGAGMSIICACDIAIAERKSYFLQAFINIGLVPDAGCTYLLPRIIGRSRSAFLMMLGEKISAEQALQYGLISKVVEKRDLYSEGMAIAQRLAKMPTKVLLSIRNLLDQSEKNTFEEQLAAEANAQQVCGHSPDFTEGVAAFLEKRAPIFE